MRNRIINVNLLAIGLIVALSGAANAATVSGLTLEDLSGGGASDITNFTIVEADRFFSGGSSGNTEKASDGTFWNSNDVNLDNDNLWWDRDGGTPGGYTGTTNRRYELKGGTESLEIITEVTFASGQYDIYIVATGRPTDNYDFTGSLNGAALTSIGLVGTGVAEDMIKEFFHIKDYSDVPGNGDIGLWAIKVGTTGAGVTSVDLHINGTNTVRIIGAGYVAVTSVVIPTPAALPAGLALLGLTAMRRRRKN